MENFGKIFHLLTDSGDIMENQPEFKPNTSLRLVDQVHQDLRYHIMHTVQRRPIETGSFDRSDFSGQESFKFG